jgi:hypothetical protein
MSHLEQVQANVSSCLDQVIEAVHRRDLTNVIEWLGKALAHYEENPSAVHEPGGQMGDLLIYIDAVLSFAGIGHHLQHVSDLQARAESLRAPLH